MDKKKKTILLLVIAAAVWGYTGLKWFNYISIDGDSTLALSVDESKIPDLAFEEREDFVLNASYPDPFLKNRKYKPVYSAPSNSNYSSNTNTVTKKVTPIPVVAVYKWPELKYSGFILSKGEKLGLLNLSGNDVLAKQGDIHQQISIVGIYSDSIQLQTAGNYKTLLKN